jgi:hypothetical protein
VNNRIGKTSFVSRILDAKDSRTLQAFAFLPFPFRKEDEKLGYMFCANLKSTTIIRFIEHFICVKHLSKCLTQGFIIILQLRKLRHKDIYQMLIVTQLLSERVITQNQVVWP